MAFEQYVIGFSRYDNILATKGKQTFNKQIKHQISQNLVNYASLQNIQLSRINITITPLKLNVLENKITICGVKPFEDRAKS